MSLLMEALRKAEAAKRAGHSVAPEPDTSVSASVESEPTYTSIQTAPEVFKYTSSEDLIALAPREEVPVEIPAPPTPTTRPPKARLNDNDDVLDDYLTTANEPELDEITAPQPSRDRVKVQEQRERAAAASMFEAKVPQGKLTDKRRQRIQILAGAMVLVVVLGGGTWWYLANVTGKSAVGVNPSIANYNLQKRGPLGEPASTDANNAAAAAAPSPSATLPTPQVANAAAATSAGKGETAPTAIATSKPAEAVLAVSDPQPNGRAADTERTAAATANSAASATPPIPVQDGVVANNADARSSGSVLEISRSNAPSKIQPALQSAYTQLQKGNLSAANDLYQELVSRYPNDRNALLGLAAVQIQLGNQNGARSTYMHLLKLNPLDALARTGMLQAIPNADPATYEKELLALRQQFPALAPLSYALGNHYAKLGRWHEAQSAYFDALLQARRETADGVSPDYPFNLAVSLEQLGKKREAVEYYKQAQLLANAIKPGFDSMMLRQRLTELERP